VILIRLVFLPLRIALGLTSVTAKTSYRTGRLLGYRRLFVFGVGVAVGLLLAPVPGRQLRARIQDEIEKRRGGAGSGDLGERVRFELSHSPRTWHLPQPDVEVIGGRAVLTGATPHETGKADLERAAAAVTGIIEVDNRLVIAGPNGSGTKGAG
jgi:hypothetical protein